MIDLNYWIGKDTDYKEIWENYNKYGDQYLSKIQNTYNYHIVIEFQEPNQNLPLLNAEAIFKTFKGIYHDFKMECLETNEYENSSPLSLYSIERGSYIFDFLVAAKHWIEFVFIFLNAARYFYKDKNEKRLIELQIEKLELEIEEIKRRNKSSSKIEKSKLEEFSKKYYFPISNILKQKIKRMVVANTEEIIGEEHVKKNRSYNP